MRTYESAAEARRQFLQTVKETARARQDAFDDADYKVGQATLEMIPGYSVVKMGVLAVMCHFLDADLPPDFSHPITFAEAGKALARYAALEAASARLGLSDMFQSTERALNAAEAGIQAALEQVEPTDMLPMVELQQRIFEQPASK